MSKRISYLILIFASVCSVLTTLSTVVLAQDDPPIVEHMKAINQNLRALRGQASQTDQKEANLELIDQIIFHAREARKLEPLKTPDLPASERAAFLEGFRKTMDEAIKVLGQLRGAIDAGNIEDAAGLLVKLNDIRKDGHSRYQKEE